MSLSASSAAPAVPITQSRVQAPFQSVEEAAFLGVSHSLCGQSWRRRPCDERTALTIAQRCSTSDVIARIAAARGATIESAGAYFSPSLKTGLPAPESLLDMDVAADRLAQAIGARETVTIFGDYDVDGATSSAMLKLYCRHFGTNAELFIPDRERDGYGPSPEAFEHLAASGAKLVITVDCGSNAHEALGRAAELGLEVVVVDHHLMGERPPSSALVNPNQAGDVSGLGGLSAGALTFLLLVAANKRLAGKGDALPDLLRWLDLVALSLICDVVPLVGPARVLAAQGLKVLGLRSNPGLSALADVADLKERPTAYHAGFLFGPRLNASGRLGDAKWAVELLTAGDEAAARPLAERLDRLNAERREIERDVLEAARSQAQHQIDASPDLPVLLVEGEDWRAGVIGIVAGRLKDQFDRPALVLTAQDNAPGAPAICVGSGRSVSGADLGEAIGAAADAGLLLKGGGHAMAAGLTVERARISELRAFLCERLGADVAEARKSKALWLDGAVAASGASADFARSVETLGPYGAGHPEPTFAVPSVKVAHARIVGEGHVSCRLTDLTGGSLRGIAFRSADTPLGEFLLNPGGRACHVAGRIRVDSWRGGASAQIHLEDAAISDA